MSERSPTHPGSLMRETIEHLGVSIAEAARRLKLSRSLLNAVLRGDAPVTADTAVRFAAIGGGEARLLLNMQVALDLWRAERDAGLSAKAKRQ